MSERKIVKEFTLQYQELAEERWHLLDSYSWLLGKLESATLSIDDTLDIIHGYDELSKWFVDSSGDLTGPLEDRTSKSESEEKANKLLTLQGWSPAIIIVAFEALLASFLFKGFLDSRTVTGFMLVPILIYFAPGLKYLFSGLRHTSEVNKESYTQMLGECLKIAQDLKKATEFLHSIRLRKETKKEDLKVLNIKEDLRLWLQEKKRLRLLTMTQKIFAKAKKENLSLVRDLNRVSVDLVTPSQGMPPIQGGAAA